MTDRFTRRIYLRLAEGGDLPAADAAHLAGCPACQAAAARAREFDLALGSAVSELSAPMPADPLAVAETRPASRSLMSAVLVVGVVLLAGGVGVGVLSMPGPEPSTTPSPSPPASAPAPSASASASTAPSPSELPPATPPPPPSPSDPAIGPGDYAVVPQGEFPLYDAPDGTPFSAALPGSDVYVVTVDGGWAEIQAQEEELPFSYVFGWVPVETLSRRIPTRCLDLEPGAPVWFGNVSHPQRDLECHGSGELVARGYAIDRSGDPPRPYRGDPSWLAGSPTLDVSGAIGPAVTTVFSFVHLPPDLEGTIPTSDREGFEGTLIEVTGHFDDPRSSECALTPTVDGYPPVRASNAELLCRQRFVVDAVVIVGVDN